MGEFCFENQGINTYLVYTFDDKDVIDTMSLGMLTNNEISGLAKALFQQMDTVKLIKYNVSSKISLEQFLSGTVNKKRVVGILLGIVNGMLTIEDYMIDLDTIVLDLKYIFVDVSANRTELVSLPVSGGNMHNMDLKKFFRNVMFDMQFDQSENCDYVTKIINYLNSVSIFVLSDFKKLLEEMKVADSVPVMAKHRSVNQAVEHVENRSDVVLSRQQENMLQSVSTNAQCQGELPQQKKENSSQLDKRVFQNQSVGQSGIDISQATSEEKQISFFQLLTHYSKENAAAYKAQKAAKKAKKTLRTTSTQKSENATALNYKTLKVNSQFAIPGKKEIDPVFDFSDVKNRVPTSDEQQLNIHLQNSPNVFQRPVSPRESIPQVKEEADFGETDYFFDGDSVNGPTIMMGMEGLSQQIAPHLIYRKNDEKIPICKTIFRLGRDVEFNDYAILDNPYIGHCHCHIVSRDGEYFIVDDNSKNHTYVDGGIVPPGREIKISHGKILRLANEEFEFRLF